MQHADAFRHAAYCYGANSGVNNNSSRANVAETGISSRFSETEILFADDFDFGFEIDVAFLFGLFLDGLDELENV